MSNKVYKRNSTVYVEDSNGDTYFFNPMLARLYMSAEGESLQIVIQDDLTGLQTFYMTRRGHVVEF